MPKNGLRNLKARYVFPVVGPPIQDGVVSISGDRMIAVGTQPLPGPVEDLGHVALLPGLINAHAHLEFSLLDRPIGQPGVSFSQWLRLLVEQFRSVPPRGGKANAPGAGSVSTGMKADPAASATAARSSSSALAIQTGLAELIRTGTTALADIAQPGFSGHLYTVYKQTGMKGIVFLELRGPTRNRVSQAIQQMQEHIEEWVRWNQSQATGGEANAEAALSRADGCWLDSFGEGKGGDRSFPSPIFSAPLSCQDNGERIIAQPVLPSAPSASSPEGEKELSCGEQEGLKFPKLCWELGVSPHAPYTVRPELLEWAISLAQKQGLPVAMHLAESLEELQFLQTGRGPLRSLLEELGQWEGGVVSWPKRPLDYLRQLAKAERALIIHGTYLDEEEWAFLAAHRDRMAVVFCPRSHAHFPHRPYPLRQMLDWGVRVILGTDSRASAPDMNLLAELRYLAAQFPEVPLRRILELATEESAQALGWGKQLGGLVPGRRADLVAVALPKQTRPADPYELIFYSPLPVVATWIAGQKVFSASPDGSDQ